MQLKLKRLNEITEGVLYVDGVFECFTLEDPTRDNKIPGETAIPAGRYPVIVNKSQRFNKLMPLLLNVPKFDGIRIHAGNDRDDTEGCILVGDKQTSPTDGWIGESRKAMDRLFAKMLMARRNKQEIWIEVEDA